jgi:hypothetical protein
LVWHEYVFILPTMLDETSYKATYFIFTRLKCEYHYCFCHNINLPLYNK